MNEFPWFPRELRDASFVPRWHIIRNIKPPNLAEHHYYVCYYSMQIHDLIKSKEPLGNVLKWALIHDLAETFTGDIPGPTKRLIVDSVKLKRFEREEMVRRFGMNDVFVSDEAKRIVKLADLIDEVMHLATEVTLGNASIQAVRDESYKRMVAYLTKNFTENEQKAFQNTLFPAILEASSTTRGSKIVEEDHEVAPKV